MPINQIPEGFVPDVGEVVVTGAIKGSKDGYVGMAFTKTTPENIGQVMNNAGLILQLYNDVEGYEWNVEVWADITEIPGQ